MDLTRYEDGSHTCADDPGEPTTGVRRISVTVGEAVFLSYLAQAHTVLEIGTGLGISTQAMEQTAALIDTLDVDPWVHANVWPELAPSTGKLKSRDGLDPFRYSMVFIDADHRYDPVMEDLAFALATIKRGVIVAHDTITVPDVAKAMDETFGERGWLNVRTKHGIGIAYVGWQ